MLPRQVGIDIYHFVYPVTIRTGLLSNPAALRSIPLVQIHYQFVYLCTELLSSANFKKIFATPWTLARQAPLFMGFSRQEYWGGLPCPPPGDLPDPGIEPASPARTGGFFTTEPPVSRYYQQLVEHYGGVMLLGQGVESEE